tara:strand:- start:4380 stop:5849 length:1470 start_codon:yes stop_codon:yes gene_type:complete
MDLNKENTIYKRTVFDLKVKINKNNLTKEDYFDLSKIKNLRVLDNGFLKILRKKYNKTQKEMANTINVPLRTWIGWESYDKYMPFKKLIILSKKLKINERELYGLIKNSKFTYGSHHGKNRLNLPVRPKEFNLVNYLIPVEPNKVYLIKNSPQKIKEYITKNFSIDHNYFKKTKLITIYSYLLYHFLKTYYIYKKEPSIKYPLSKEVSKWIKKRIDIKKAILIPLLLSDGGEKPKNRLFISGASKRIHNIWSDAWFHEHKLYPSSFLLPHKSIFVTTHKVDENILSKLKNICPNFKTSPRNTTINKYMNSPQPSIKYIFNRPKLEQEIAIRLWANTEGSIGINLNKRGGLINPSLKIACAHPYLTKELRKLCKENKINLSIIKENKNWFKIGGLKSTSITSTINFLKIGGFIKGTKIKHNSKYFHDLDKQDVLLSILEFIITQRKENNKITNIDKAYKSIKNIVINKKYKNKEYYLKEFKNFNNWSFRK